MKKPARFIVLAIIAFALGLINDDPDRVTITGLTLKGNFNLGKMGNCLGVTLLPVESCSLGSDSGRLTPASTSRIVRQMAEY